MADVTFPCMLYDLPKARVHLMAEAFGMRFYCGGFETFAQAETETGNLISRFCGRGASVSFYMVDSAGSHFLSADMIELSRMVDAKERETLAAEYVELIGYDPFEDDPTITATEVRETLRGYKLIAQESAE